jgi:hypothetical protein
MQNHSKEELFITFLFFYDFSRNFSYFLFSQTFNLIWFQVEQDILQLSFNICSVSAGAEVEIIPKENNILIPISTLTDWLSEWIYADNRKPNITPISPLAYLWIRLWVDTMWRNPAMKSVLLSFPLNAFLQICWVLQDDTEGWQAINPY